MGNDANDLPGLLTDQSLRKFSNGDFTIQPVGGGSINHTYQLKTAKGRLAFLKVNSSRTYPGLFRKEAAGLRLLAAQDIFRIPEVLLEKEEEQQQLLLLEWIADGSRTTAFWKSFGEKLARLHQCTQSSFGLGEDNYMGALHQDNRYQSNWIGFFATNRLQPQVALAIEKGLLDSTHISMFEKLYSRLPMFFEEEPPALLHGDLWSGNYICDENSNPVLIDPAVYHGHRGMDLAMTTLFGSFDKVFYDSYHHHYPLPANHHEQWDICNLYPLLVHLNLFGKGYLSGISAILRRFT